MTRNQRLPIRLALLLPLLLGSWLSPAALADQAADTAPAPAAAPPAGTAADATFHRRLERDLQHDIARVQPWLDRYGYAAVALVVGAEGAGVPTPGQTLLVVAALDAAAHPRLRIGWLLLVTYLASVLGNALGYVIGRRGGRVLLARWGFNAERLARVDAGFARWGGWLVVFGRFIDGPRQLLSIAAGVLEMPWPRFALFTLVGAALWVGVWGFGVYYLDEHLYAMIGLIRRISPWTAAATLAALVVGVIALVWWRLTRGRPAAGT
ncbi:DedA family protein [Candidatus Thiodictyon syntrophicum]|jgi:membrane protein DedA with SNARE-associated domain|uniref:VTT domain-containing protein n=1 Tax=Candidatus Thiodictyon syntrophicum TaxID=1166950 RepID=A0A2K8UAG9_9GAMM|nr:DedA family protein [Candidatus Thiodictyon syntrophicum]AUB82583.1 hypothetical protein THSYN_17620 [Candidatus Thiodictyon syntrophicum]